MAKKNGKLTSSAHGSSQHDLFIIDDETLANPAIKDQVYAPTIDGEVKGHGLVPRDLAIYPPEMFDPPSQLPLIPQSEWVDRISQIEREQSGLEHMRDFPSLDQNGQGYCWAYSTTSCVMLLRCKMNQPRVRLSAHAIGCMVKNFRDEGGWCGLSAKFQREKGCPSVEFWAEKSMSRGNDRPETWANAAQHKVTEEWVDLARPVYDQNLTWQQVATCMLARIPCAVDFNHWSHSVCAIALVKVESGSFGLKILNSWSDQWGDRGTGILRGGKERPDGAVALRVSIPSDK